MTFAPAGYPAMALAGTAAVSMLATAVWRRSWLLWLAGMALLIVAAIVAWSFRGPPTAAAAAVVAVGGVDGGGHWAPAVLR